MAFVVVLPTIKLAYKFAIVSVAAKMEDLAPATVVSVDLFDALYTTKCMQSAGSLWVGFAIITFDVTQNGIAVSSLCKQFTCPKATALSNPAGGRCLERHSTALIQDAVRRLQ